MVLLVRDPRDVVASVLDAQEGNWMYEAMDESRRGRATSADKNRTAYARILAKRYVRQMSSGKEAFDAHRGPKTLVRYEDLRSDTLGTMRRLCSELRLPAEAEWIARAVGERAWDNVPPAEKGEGKFYRKGQTGGLEGRSVRETGGNRRKRYHSPADPVLPASVTRSLVISFLQPNGWSSGCRDLEPNTR